MSVKRILAMFLLLTLLLTACSAKAGEPAASGEDEVEEIEGLVEISEKLFIAQTNDVYVNPEEYFDKTIRYEGLLKSLHWSQDDTTYHYVIRYGPGCCGYDGEAGFEVAWDGEWPKDNAWCRVTGTLEEYTQDNILYLRLVLSSLEELEERGAEFVNT